HLVVPFSRLNGTTMWSSGGSSDGRHLATESSLAAIVLETPPGRAGWSLHGSLHGCQDSSTGLAFDHSGRHLPSSFATGIIHVWDFAKNEVFSARRGSQYPTQRETLRCASLDTQGERVAYARGTEVVIERWQVRGGIRRVDGRCPAFSADGKR